jgi:DNA (cytosine-5)-methyltransferase 1
MVYFACRPCLSGGDAKTKNKPTAVSLFSGCGGFDWGAQQAGVEIIWANDIDPHAVAAYQSLFPNVECVRGDVRDIKTFPQADILIGCYPCTGFSLAARRRWRDSAHRDLLEDDGNFLFREFLRALSQVRAKYLFVENVRGMASANDGWFLEQQLQGFRQQGYSVQCQLLHTGDFGLPQSRKRLFIVGVRSDHKEFTYEFPKPTHGGKGQLPFVLLRDAISHMPAWPEGEYYDRSFHGHYLTRNRKRAWGELSYTIVANAHHVPLHPMGEPMKYVKKDTWALQGEINRRLSWRECAVIQGLPTKFAPSGELMDKYRIVGNAVPPAFGRALLESVVQFECK